MDERKRPHNKETAVMRSQMAGNMEKAGKDVSRERIRLLGGLVLAMVILAVLVMAAKPGTANSEKDCPNAAFCI